MPKQNKFLLKATRVHLTFKSHIDHEVLLEHIANVGKPIRHHSIVWENADESDPYPHTHALIWFRKQLSTRNPRLFDIKVGESEHAEIVHPNIKVVNTDDHWKNTWGYHEKDYVFLSPMPHNNPITAAKDLIAEIKKAKSLTEAMEIADIQPRSVADLVLIRNDKAKRPPTVAAYDTFDRPDLTTTLGPWRVVVIHGTAGSGKTQYALSQFKNPLLVSHMDDLRTFNQDEHDGIVFDDMSFGHYPRESNIHLLDWDVDRSIHCRYSCAWIPARTKKIFTSNRDPADIFGECWDAPPIQRRITKVIKIEGKMFGNAPPPTPEPEKPDLRVWEGDVLIRDANGEPTEAVPFGLRNVGIFNRQDYYEEMEAAVVRQADAEFDEELDRLEALADSL